MTENIKRRALCLTALTLTAVSDDANGIEELTPFQELCGAFRPLYIYRVIHILHCAFTGLLMRFHYMAPYSRPITSRCYVSTFRTICDSFREVISEEVENSLRTINIHQFLFFPAFQQNMPLMYELLKCWDSTEDGFKIKDHLLKFTTDEVAVLTGLPNTGAEIIWHNELLGVVLSTELKSEMGQLSRSTDDATMLKTFISFVVSNLFFPLNSLKTPRRLVSIASSLEEFSSINWAWTLREFMVNEFNRMATKLATEKPLGYINGFLPLLLVMFLEHVNVNTPRNPDSRPRFLRWEGNTNIFYSSEKAAHLVATLKEKHIVYILDGLSAEEADLVHADLTSFQPPPSPLKQKSHEPSDLPPAKKIRIKTSQKQKSLEHELPYEGKEEFQAAKAFAQPEWLSHLEERMHNLIDAVSRKIQKDIEDRIDKIEDNLQRVEGNVDDLQYKFINHCLQCPVDPERTTAESSSSSTESSHESVEQPLAKWKRLRKFTPTVDEEPPIPMDEQLPTTTEQEATPLGNESPPIPMDEQPPTTIEQEATPLGDESPPITTIQDVIFSSGNVILTRRDIDHILLDDCLDNFHIDAYAFFVDRKTKAFPAIYQPYLYISPIHRINELYIDLIKCFDADITKWRINIVRGTPTQSNSFDCGMFVCKYMEKVVVKDKVDWSAYKYWQNEMLRYRADFAYQILLEGETVELKHVKKRIESAAKAH
ncbi:hypothetical protein M5K25_021396 [Dendrobium thyrsiflorum]|uniref:Ubiquitin-like protease family profile domain-containing protein n=1 Tax=Dendrobium thyrsiflorum TaxID=117978 RepID=A0ABD0UD35_DENTH